MKIVFTILSIVTFILLWLSYKEAKDLNGVYVTNGFKVTIYDSDLSFGESQNFKLQLRDNAILKKPYHWVFKDGSGYIRIKPSIYGATMDITGIRYNLRRIK